MKSLCTCRECIIHRTLLIFFSPASNRIFCIFWFCVQTSNVISTCNLHIGSVSMLSITCRARTCLFFSFNGLIPKSCHLLEDMIYIIYDVIIQYYFFFVESISLFKLFVRFYLMLFA